MDLRDRLFLRFAASPGLKALAYVLFLAGGLLLFQGPGAVLLAVPLLADAYGARLIRALYDGFREDLLELLEDEARRECGLAPDEEGFPVWEYDGCVRHWLVKGLPDRVILTLMAPRQDFLVVARKEGRIFPPLSYAPLDYEILDAGTLDVYYRDITHVEVNGEAVVLHTSGGEVIEYEDHSGGAGQAVRELRERLREHKARSSP
ncbi:hypothetical protein M7784_13980 [Desulfovibrio aminophilus]|nr:hypothetical protein [Desulfovibrio aminophilus]MCM0756341.1 hypothetical protein [Desulfovibrio aminophilus]